MAASFQFELVSPERLLLSEPVAEVTVPGTEGDFTVLAGHAPFMSTIRPGFIAVNRGSGAALRIFVRGGFAEVGPDSLTILAEQAIPAEELRADQLAAEIRDAEEDLADARSDEAKTAAQTKLDQLRAIRDALAG